MRMNCPECKKLLYANQRSCACGWKTIVQRNVEPPRAIDTNHECFTVRRIFAKRLEEVNLYVDKYIASHPGVSKREACMQYMQERGLIKALPVVFQDEEARLEREAIQQENYGAK